MTALLAFGQIERNLQYISDAIYRQIWAKFFETTSKEVTPFDDFGKSFDINRKVFENFQKFFGWKFLEVNVKDTCLGIFRNFICHEILYFEIMYIICFKIYFETFKNFEKSFEIGYHFCLTRIKIFENF